MRAVLAITFLSLSMAASGQTIVESMQTTEGDKVLAMNILGNRNGEPFNHKIRFDVSGMTKIERDSLYQQTLRTIALLGVKDVPGLRKPGSDPDKENQGEKVTFRCEMCAGKGVVEVYGDNFLLTRSFNSRRDTQPFFPLTIRLGPGEYRLVYRQNGYQKIESSFSVHVDETNEVRIK